MKRNSQKLSTSFFKKGQTKIAPPTIHRLIEQNNYSAINEWLSNPKIETNQTLLEERDSEGNAPIHVKFLVFFLFFLFKKNKQKNAFIKGDSHIVEEFINFYSKHNANPNVKDHFGCTPLHLLISNSNIRFKHVEAFLKNSKVNVFSRNK